ncbi:family 61 putative glycoside hydrolase [Parachaetomium inaequale]|uniref:lytic cellulose monooxygenase (C4-dehydrogenating) n=1 Tax=Parachaetomium inaequale TaxID=2588326 RepID=A0AAN6P8U7_9PEZI|nr:family 61 putative glycoside hydrolase [Parachaetomium inaequale]
MAAPTNMDLFSAPIKHTHNSSTIKSTVLIALAVTAQAHTIFQSLSVNGADQGQLVGLRAPKSNNPIYDVIDQQLACGHPGSHSDKVINVKAGDRIGAKWGHVLGGAQRPNDRDNPIASSHKGPISTYMARVDNAATASPNGLKWFKIHEDGLDTRTGKWGVDNMIAAAGWAYATIPRCLAPGQYLLRQELLALHSAGSVVPSATVSIPGAYKQDDKGILLQIWVKDVPNNGRKAYTVPGPRPMSC